MISAHVLSGLIGDIYDCVIEPERWGSTLGRIRETVNCLNAILAVQSLPSGRILLTVTSNIDDAHLAALAGYEPDVIDQWGGLEAMMSHSYEEPAVLSWERPRELWESNRYFVEWAKPQGIFDVLGIIAARDSEAYGSLGFARHVSAGPVTEDEVATLRLIVSHIQRAVSISRILDIKTIAARTFESTLDGLPSGIVLVDTDLHIVHANEAADVMLAAGDPISSVDGKLEVRFGPAQRALGDAVAQASADEALIGRRGFGVPARLTNGEPVVLHVLPLKHGSLRPGLSPSAVAAILVAPAASPHPAPEQVLAALFDLTPAEAKVFSAIASGETLARTAETLGVGQSTAKTHLSRLFVKTGTGRQADLVKLAGSLALFG